MVSFIVFFWFLSLFESVSGAKNGASIGFSGGFMIFLVP